MRSAHRPPAFVVAFAAFVLSLPFAARAQEKPAEAQQPPAGQQASQPAPAAPQAAKPGEEPPRFDEQVTVSAPRMDIPLVANPAATSVVGDLTLTSLPRAVGAEEALQIVPGLKVDNQADGERVHLSIRGQGLLTERGIRGITVLLDGIPLNDPSGFVPDLFDVDWSGVSRIEVLRGVASALYGGASAGGIINITTAEGGPGRASGEAELTGGSYGFWKGSAAAGGTAGDLNYRVSASANRGDAYRLHANFDAWNVRAKVGWRPSEGTRLTAVVAGTHYYNGNPEGLNLAWTPESLGQPVEWDRMANPDSITYNEYQRTGRLHTGLTGTTRLARNQDLSFVLFYRRTGWQEAVPSSVDHRMYDNPGGNVQYVLHWATGSTRNHLTAGLDASWQGIDEFVHPNLGNAVEGPELLADQAIAQRGYGLYAIDRLEFTRRWGAMVSVRHDSIRNELTDRLQAGGVDLSGVASFAETTGRVGVSYNPRARLGLYASWGQGFLPPATEELARNPDHIGGFNTHLVPATSQGGELGLRGSARRFSYDVAFFRLTTENDFGRYRVPGRPLETFYGNVGSSRRYGLETSAGYYPWPSLAIRGAYTYSDFLYTDVQFMYDRFTNTVMPNSPRHQAAFDAQYSIGGHWLVGLHAFGQSFQYVDQGNTLTADGFALVTPRLAYRWMRGGYDAELAVQARNVAGSHWMAFTEPDPDQNSFQPGPTRELFVGFRVGFGTPSRP